MDPKLWITLGSILLSAGMSYGMIRSELNNIKISIARIEDAQTKFITRDETSVYLQSSNQVHDALASRIARLEALADRAK